MKKIISLLALVCLICCMFPVSAFAFSDTEYIRDGQSTGIWYSNPATKEALDKCEFSVFGKNGVITGIDIHLNYSTIDIYDDLLITGPHDENADSPPYYYSFLHGTIRCHNCRAFNLYEDNIWLHLTDVHIEGGRAICPDDNDYGYGGAIYVDGAGCAVVDTHQSAMSLVLGRNGEPSNVYTQTHSYIEDCYADEYGGAIAVCGHDCIINGLTFQSNTGYNNGGNDLYVYWGDCHVNGCTFDIDKEGAVANITADTYFDNCNITKKMCIGDLHQVFITNPAGSMLSVGRPEIVYGIGGLAVGFIAAMLIFRKKKTAVSSASAENEE